MTDPTPHTTHRPHHPAHHETRHNEEKAARFESGDFSGEPPLRKRREFGRPHALVVIGTALSLVALAGFILLPYLYKASG
ncbi:hypothetical protein T281_00920 [Rhodomicrobium udaipurense JA643]|uniref:Uncharacterized protein n=1 Tax=Rhodomicrobium udaipurense TaxID=1202716 RepID=A0A8I1GH90_9HYPH|nr:hypothetical protein [Rhodomicrobium udaipurense]KAI96279.1 hypothetical protein T281_00920 [Rhodomicrobium udaipurense JA643]MBJ7544814.1 hypothetical protein [Rhodomicrobium udaipurense]